MLLSVNKQSGTNAVQVAQAVNEEMQALLASYPSLHYSIIMDQSDYINLSVDSALQNIVLGVIIAALVLLVFLRRFGATATIAISMPVCIITVFLLMRICGLTLNMMSLGGIAMGVGMIVDNSIVVLENIFRYRSDGKTRLESCSRGIHRKSLCSITASTLTTVAVFVPIGTDGRYVGQIFKDFTLTIAFLILSSLVIALTLVPLLCYYLLGDGTRNMRIMAERAQRNRGKIERLSGWYQKTLSYFLHRRRVAVLISVLLLVLFSCSIAFSNIVLLPDMDQSQVDISISLPAGAELEQAMVFLSVSVPLPRRGAGDRHDVL